jgi:hypothetical protein
MLVEDPKSASQRAQVFEKLSNYMLLMSRIIDAEPSSFKEVTDQKVSKDAMVDEYTYIMRNYVWDIVPRPEGK